MADKDSTEEKTEEATPKRQQESREKGQVAFSQEMTAALMLVGIGISFFLAGPRFFRACGEVVTWMIGQLPILGTAEVDTADMAALIRDVGEGVYPSFLMVIMPMLGVGVVIAYAQIGFQISPKAIALDLTKLNPIKGVGRMFSMRSVVKTGLATGKISVIMTAIFAAAWMQIGDISSLGTSELGPALRGVITVVTRCAITGLVAIVALAVVDLLYQRFQHAKDQRMSKKEVKDEWKSSEGDPHIKSRIRQIQREMASRRMMQEVPNATVVVTNPTHYAVALEYERESDESAGRAPRVLAKGVDHVAQQIKKIATENDVPLYEDVPLARALHAQCEIGDQIPEDLFHAVAGVLAYVYRLEKETESA
jgi:flagellar biosynthetic protein FlhB